MYNKESCKACGGPLTPISLCVICSEQVSWICKKCDRSYDVTHTHKGEPLAERFNVSTEALKISKNNY